jgi:hypothetical protein
MGSPAQSVGHRNSLGSPCEPGAAAAQASQRSSRQTSVYPLAICNNEALPSVSGHSREACLAEQDVRNGQDTS